MNTHLQHLLTLCKDIAVDKETENKIINTWNGFYEEGKLAFKTHRLNATNPYKTNQRTPFNYKYHAWQTGYSEEVSKYLRNKYKTQELLQNIIELCESRGLTYSLENSIVVETPEGYSLSLDFELLTKTDKKD